MDSHGTTNYNFKVVLLGEGCVGKTSVVLRYVEDTFNSDHVTTLQVSTTFGIPLSTLSLQRPKTSTREILENLTLYRTPEPDDIEELRITHLCYEFIYIETHTYS